MPYLYLGTKKFAMKTSTCRNGSLKNLPNLDGNGITILSPSLHLAPFANYAFCLLLVRIGGLRKAVTHG